MAKLFSPAGRPLLLPGGSDRALVRPDVRSLVVPRSNGTPIGAEVDFDELVIHTQYRVYEEQRPSEVRYMMYELSQKSPDQPTFDYFFKAVRLCKVTRVPRYLRQSASGGPAMVIDQQRDLLAGLREKGIVFLNVIAKCPDTALLFTYGVSGVGSTPEEAQYEADQGYAALIAQLDGLYQQLEYRSISLAEGESLVRYQSEWNKIAMARGRPLPNGVSGGTNSALDGNRTDVENTLNQLEGFLRGMTDRNFIMSLVCVPITAEEMTTAWRNVTGHLSKIRSEQSGSRSLSAGVAIPLSFGSSLGQTAGNSHATGATQGIAASDGVSHSIADGTSASQSVGHTETAGMSVGQSLTDTHAQSVSFGQSVSEGATQGVSLSQSVSESVGFSESLTDSASSSVGQSASVGTSTADSLTQGASLAQGQSASLSQGQSLTDSVGFSESLTASQGQSLTDSIGISESHTVSQGQSLTESASLSESQSVSATSSVGQSQSSSFSESAGTNWSNTLGQSLQAGTSESSGWNTGTSTGLTSGINVGGSEGTSQGNGVNSNVSGGFGGGFPGILSGNQSASEGTNTQWGINAGSNFGANLSGSSGSSEGVSGTQGTSLSQGVSVGESAGGSASQTAGLTNGVSVGQSVGETLGVSSSLGQSFGQSIGESHGVSASQGQSFGQSIGVAHGVGTNVGQAFGQTVGVSQGTSTSLAESLSAGRTVGLSAGESVNQGAAVGRSQGFGVTQGTAAGLSTGESLSTSRSMSSSTSEGLSTSRGFSQSQGQSFSQAQSLTAGQGVSRMETAGTSQGLSANQGFTDAYTVAMSRAGTQSSSLGAIPSVGIAISKNTFDERKRMIGDVLETQANRYMQGLESGAFFYQLFLACPDVETLAGASALLKSSFWGPSNDKERMIQPFHVVDPADDAEASRLYTHGLAFTHYRKREPNTEIIESHAFSTYTTCFEVATMCHPPTAEAIGLLAVHDSMPVMAMPADRQNRDLQLGRVVNGERGRVSDIRFGVDVDELTHTLIAGTTGSGKTTTLMSMLAELTKVEREITERPPGSPDVEVRNVRAGVVALDWMSNMRDLASVVEPDRFRFYSVANPSLGAFRWNPFAVPDTRMNPMEWANDIADQMTVAFSLAEFGRSLVAEFIGELYTANRLEPYPLVNEIRDEMGNLVRPAVYLDPVDRATLPPDAIAVAPDGTEVANVLTCPELSRLVSMEHFAAIVAARVEEAATPEGARLMGQSMRDRLQSLWRRVQGFAPGSPFAGILTCDPSLDERSTVAVTDLIDPERGLVAVIEADGLDQTNRKFILGAVLLALWRFGQFQGVGALDHHGKGPGTWVVLEEAHELFGPQGEEEDNFTAATRSSLYESLFRRSRALGMKLVAVVQNAGSVPTAITSNVSTVFVHRQYDEGDRKRVFNLLNWNNQLGQQQREWRYLGEMARGFCIARLDARESWLESAPIHFRTEPAALAQVSDHHLAELAASRAVR